MEPRAVTSTSATYSPERTDGEADDSAGVSYEELERAKSRLLAEAAKLATDKICADVVADYWRYVPADEITGRSPEDLIAAVESHRKLAGRRLPGQVQVEIRTPDPDTERWAGGHTVIEIVTDDMSFLVDSVTAELENHSLNVHLFVHPQVRVRRDALGALEDVVCGPPADGTQPVGHTAEWVPAPAETGGGSATLGEYAPESWMHIEVDRMRDESRFDDLKRDLRKVLTDVKDAVEDWQKMREQALAIADELGTAALPVPDKDVTDARELLRWLADEHFTFLGYREYSLDGEPGQEELRAVVGTGLGILRSDQTEPRSFGAMAPEVRERALEKRLLVVTKASSRSTVHRPVYLDYIGFKTFDDEGNVTGERRFLGLFSSAAYLESVRNLPVVKRKVAEVVARSGLAPRSHDGKRLINILETYPRDELFQIATNRLYEVVMQVLRLGGRRQLRLFLRQDGYGRFVSCLVYLPRDRYTTQIRLRMQDLLAEQLHGVGVDHTARVTESPLARVHFVVRTDPSRPPRGLLDREKEIQHKLAEATRPWTEAFHTAVIEEIGEESAGELYRRYVNAFPEAYKEEHSPTLAVEDLSRIEALEEPGALAIKLYRPYGRPEDLRFTVFRVGAPLSLSEVLPVLQSLGVGVVDERPYRIVRPDGPEDTREVWVYDFGLRSPEHVGPVEKLHGAVENAFTTALRGESEVDGFNALVLSAGLTWQQVVVLRAYAKYLRQTGTIHSQDYMERTLAAHPTIAGLLVELFEARFDPRVSDADRATATDSLVDRIHQELDEVASLDQDRIVRSFLALVAATLRTNRFQRGRRGRPKPYLSLKIDPAKVPDLPLPRPKFEIFVYSPRVEGVHLRFGAVARGGLRWSDRHEDFRTEILGLVKAQAVKNSVIVPVGAKGGFVAKRLPAERDAMYAEGIACYKMFISGLLDVTDNLVEGKVVPPPQVVRHDPDDSYLVVAADKGTAKFSDIANEVAGKYGFWLGDAFASGGSAGYDHKAMGITARGAWESVKRHFRELGVDTQNEEFTVVGIGDMSGDVFGNGMLLSRHIRLVAAFDHRHVFLDPDPDPAKSFAERERLFALPRSSWDDYDRSVISAGGGVWPRTAKSLPVSPQVRQVLGLRDDVKAMAPPDLIRAILLAPVDLLWNGGIGTYVKASDETHAEVGDKANDAVRVDGRSLRCKVVGEGGNLGLTQRGRVQYALTGGRICSDAIDNSAGVDTSDREVNIKIMLSRAVDAGALAADDRDVLLAEMTDEVASLVLRDNYEQNVVIGNARAQAGSLLSVHVRLMAELERIGVLDRPLEFLPDDEEINRRDEAGLGLTSPELSVLLAYVKNHLADTVLASTLPDEPWCRHPLVAYFPSALRERYAEAMYDHPLHREITTTQVVNDLVNRGGISFVFRAEEETGANPVDVVRAFVVIREVFGLRELWSDVMALDNKVPTAAQTAVLLEARRLLDRAVRWLVQNRRSALDVDAEIDRLRPGVAELLPKLPALMCGSECEALAMHAEELVDKGVPPDMANRVTHTLYGFGLLDVVEVALRVDRPVLEVAEIYYTVSERFRIDALLDRVSALPRDDRWRSLARMALRYDLYAALAELTVEVVQSTDGGSADRRVAQWEQSNASSIARAENNLRQFREDAAADLAVLSVLLRQIRTLVRASSAA
jgi:glutamate dehydrogenase